jgi:hypothetical protein
MSSSHSKTDYLIQFEEDGKIRLLGPGQIPAGTILNGRTMITVAGPGWDFAPNQALTKEECEAWIKAMREKGYTINTMQW